MNYFNKIPSITYDGYTCKNLLARAAISRETKANKQIFYPYTMQNEMRVDQLADRYYDSPEYTWIVWYSNDTIDPYYDYPLSQNEFERFMIDKYGSVESAQRKIYYYRVDWSNNDTILSISQFEGLAGSFKKYYDPIVNADLTLVGYRRKRDDDTVATNRVLSLSVSNVSNSTVNFTTGEEIQIDPTNYAFCTSSNTTVVTVQHITGSFTANSTYTPIITGRQSGTQATVTAVNQIAVTSAWTDSAYWTPVTYYDYEDELNERKKEMQLIDVRYASQLDNELQRVMQA
jgi:hypothetical protein